MTQLAGAGAPFLLSHEQESLWYREVLTGQPGVTNAPAALRIRGPLNPAALRAACESLTARHEALRTIFTAEDGLPRQRVRAGLPADFAVCDAADEAAARRAGRAELIRPFDLETGPPIRFRLYRLAPGHHILILIVHHLVTDAASIGIMMTEIGESYRAAVAGRAADLAAPALRYADFVAEQRADAGAGRMSELRSYWTTRLAGAPQTIDLVPDHPRRRSRGALGGVVRDRIASEIAGAVAAFARETRVTEFVVLLTMVRLLLWRTTGQRDILIGAPVSGRDYAGTDDVVGFFISMLVLRNEATGRRTFRELVSAERAGFLGALDHKDMPYSELVAALRPERDPASSPLVQATFSYRPADAGPPGLPGLEVTDFELEGTSLQFDLVLEMLRDSDGVDVLCGYNEELFARQTMTSLTGRLPVLMTAALAGPDVPVARLPWLTAADARAVARAADGPPRPAPSGHAPSGHAPSGQHRGDSVLGSFSGWVRRAPGATAVRHADALLTYAELDAHSDGIAARLRYLCLDPEAVAGVLIEDRSHLPAILLGVAKAGCAALPLDPAHPGDRHAYVLADAGARILITDREPPGLPDGRALPVLDPRLAVRPEPACAPVRLARPDPDQLAYVFYTSGSAGRPKGVGISHRGFANCVHDTRDELGIRPGERLAASSPVSFDIGVLEIWTPLAAGAELVLSETSRRGDGAALAEFLERWQPDYFFATPALWQLLASVAGLWQMYGPTETTVYCTRDLVPADRLPENLPVGRPIRDTSAQVLDEWLRPVAPGVVGELCLGGAGLARGYHGRPGATADRFVPSPFGPPGARLYRTGDLARLLPDGRLELRGRNDRQIKINGQRIEPGEIEAVLCAHDRVRAAAVVVVPAGGTAARRLVACLRTGDGEADAELIASVRAHARRQLPATMVPAAYRVVDAFPVTDNGKLDRHELAAVAARTADAPGRPFDEHELLVAQAWGAVLGASEIGPDDDFFALGGNSLLAAQMMSRLWRGTGARMPMSALLDTPTLTGFAGRLREARAQAAGRPAADGSIFWLRRAENAPVLALAPPAGGSALCYREIIAALGGDWQICAFETPAPPGPSLESTAAGYLAELSGTGSAPVVFAGWSLGGLLAYEMGSQAVRDGTVVPFVVVIDTATPESFDWDLELAPRPALENFVRELGRMGGAGLGPVPPGLWSRPRAELFSWAAGVLGFGDPAELDRRFAIFSASLRAARDYVPGAARVDLHFIAPGQGRGLVEPWLDLADSVTVTTVSGDHYSAIGGPGARQIADVLTAQQAQGFRSQ